MKARPAMSLVKWIVVAAVVVAGGVAVVALVRMSRPAVVVTELVQDEAVQAFYATGTLDPADREHPIRAAVEGFVRPPTDGAKLIDKGDFVRKGQVIGVVFSEEFERVAERTAADLAEKRQRADPAVSPVLKGLDAQVTAAAANVEVAQSEVDRLTNAQKSAAASTTDVNNAIKLLNTARMLHAGHVSDRGQAKLRLDRELAEAESAHRIAEWNRQQTKLISPVDGYAQDKPQPTGTKVAVGDLVVTIANTAPNNLVMRAQVDEEDVTRVFPPTPKMPLAGTLLGDISPAHKLMATLDRDPQVVRMTLYAFADESFAGRVVRIYPKADPERRTFEVDVAIDAPSPLMKAGMTGELAFETDRKQRATIAPSQALQDGKFWVVRDGKLTAADATPGLRSVERVEAVGQLRPGDQVVISPVAGMPAGTPVRVGQVMDPRAAADANKPKKKEIFRGGF